MISYDPCNSSSRNNCCTVIQHLYPTICLLELSSAHTNQLQNTITAKNRHIYAANRQTQCYVMVSVKQFNIEKTKLTLASVSMPISG